jgi:hypothetical protein
LTGDESVEIGVGELAARPLGAVADGHVTERTGCNMTVKRLDRAVQLCRRFAPGAQTIGDRPLDLASACTLEDALPY